MEPIKEGQLPTTNEVMKKLGEGLVSVDSIEEVKSVDNK